MYGPVTSHATCKTKLDKKIQQLTCTIILELKTKHQYFQFNAAGSESIFYTHNDNNNNINIIQNKLNTNFLDNSLC